MNFREHTSKHEARFAWLALVLFVLLMNAVADSASCPFEGAHGDDCGVADCDSDRLFYGPPPVVFGNAPQLAAPLEWSATTASAEPALAMAERPAKRTQTVLLLAPKTSPPA